DRIRVVLAGPETVTAAVAAHQAWIAGEVLAVDLGVGDVDGQAHTISVDDAAVQVRLERV
ncbi:MAG: DUF5915 domain-containing protein, partial [Actinomycetota bacterium]|nr:DUF5915 domain-containing protein [Actinomycetota bacterium]